MKTRLDFTLYEYVVNQDQDERFRVSYLEKVGLPGVSGLLTYLYNPNWDEVVNSSSRTILESLRTERPENLLLVLGVVDPVTPQTRFII